MGGQTASGTMDQGGMKAQSADQQNSIDPLLLQAIMSQMEGAISPGLGHDVSLTTPFAGSLGQYGIPFGGAGPQQNMIAGPQQSNMVAPGGQGTDLSSPIIKAILGGVSQLSKLAQGQKDTPTASPATGGTDTQEPQGTQTVGNLASPANFVGDLSPQEFFALAQSGLSAEQISAIMSGIGNPQVSGGELGMDFGPSSAGGTLGQAGGSPGSLLGAAGGAAGTLGGLYSLYQGVDKGNPLGIGSGALQTGQGLYSLAGQGYLGAGANSLAGEVNAGVSGLGEGLLNSLGLGTEAGAGVSGAAGAAGAGAGADAGASAGGAAAGSALGAYNIASLVYSLGKLGFELGLGSSGPTSGNQYMDLAMGLLGPVGDVIGGFSQPAFQPSMQYQEFGNRLAQTLGGERQDIQNIITALGDAKTQGDVQRAADLFAGSIGPGIGGYSLAAPTAGGAPQLSGLPGAGGGVHEKGARANFDQPIGLVNQLLAAMYPMLPAGPMGDLSGEAYGLGLTNPELTQFNQTAQTIMGSNPQMSGEQFSTNQMPPEIMAMMAGLDPRVQNQLVQTLLPQIRSRYNLGAPGPEGGGTAGGAGPSGDAGTGSGDAGSGDY